MNVQVHIANKSKTFYQNGSIYTSLCERANPNFLISYELAIELRKAKLGRYLCSHCLRRLAKHEK